MARPARDYADACARFAALAALDGPRIIPEGRSRFYSRGSRSPLAVVLLHGLTNVPEQWARFAEELHERGHTVVIPRFPGHGDVDRRGTALGAVVADDFLRTASEATDIAAGAGERVVVAGLSIGGAIAAWLAQRRTDIARCVPIVPLFGIARLNASANACLVALLRKLPDYFIPWDPHGSAHESPPYAYPNFPTHALAECVRIGLDVHRSAKDRPPGGTTAMLLNAREPACNNALAFDVAANFGRAAAGACDALILEGLPLNHDVIDPTNPNARIDVIYPRVRALIEG
ncbi:MAG: alpha/beta fold hydrolase [Candidatus Eremiobacteraeota bacterium]|nr:alpha/beta fold hydrolase [Candidatus Eremiobacteraeota bacterium]